MARCSHWSHGYLIPSCLHSLCRFKSLDVVAAYSHWSHGSRKPSCLLDLCRFKLLLCDAAYSHWSHWNSFPACLIFFTFLSASVTVLWSLKSSGSVLISVSSSLNSSVFTVISILLSCSGRSSGSCLKSLGSTLIKTLQNWSFSSSTVFALDSSNSGSSAFSISCLNPCAISLLARQSSKSSPLDISLYLE